LPGTTATRILELGGAAGVGVNRSSFLIGELLIGKLGETVVSVA
jgi:hypothetical protein